MAGALFGAMAMFYSVSAGAGGALTPPVTAIGAVPQIQFGTALTTGGYLSNEANGGTHLTDGCYYDGTNYIAEDNSAAILLVNSAAPGFGIAVGGVGSALTPGVAFTPTQVMYYVGGTGNNIQFVQRGEFTAGALVSGGTNPTIGDSLSITKTNIAAKNWTAGTYNTLAIQASNFNFQTSLSGTGVDGSFAIGFASTITHTHAIQTGAAETLYIASISDDATAKFQILNATSVNGTFIPKILGIGSSTNQALIFQGDITTDTGTAPAFAFNVRTTSPAAIAVRPLYDWQNNGTSMSQMLADGSQWWNTAPNNYAAGQYLLAGRRLYTGTSGSLTVGDFELFANPGSASSATYSAVDAYASTNAGNAQNITGSTGLVGLRAGAQHRGTATVTGLAAIVAGSNSNSGGGTITNNYGVYVGTQTVGTNNYSFFGAGGNMDNAGAIRATGSANYPNGSGIELNYAGGTGRIQVYNYSGSAFLPLSIQGLSVTIAPNGGSTASFTASNTAFNTPVQFPSYTLATLPTTASYTRGMIWVSDMTGGAQYAYSDGTNWRRVSDNTIAS